MEKTKISAFEYAIMGYADSVEAEKYQPRTKDEEIKHRITNLKHQASKLKVNHPLITKK